MHAESLGSSLSLVQCSALFYFSAGIIPGDLITEIDGKLVKSSADVYKALEGDNAELSITVQRTNGYHIVKIKPISQ